MSVFPEFIQHIHDIGMYVPGHNYEEMYNIMIYNLTYNIIPTNNFVYTYAFMNQLYDHLEELLMYSEPEVETNETNETNNLNLPINDDINDIYTIQDNQDQNQPQDEDNQNQNNPPQDENNQNQNNQYQDEDNQNALQLFHNYIITIINNPPMNNPPMNNQPMNNLNYTNDINPNNFTYTNLVYYNNT